MKLERILEREGLAPIDDGNGNGWDQHGIVGPRAHDRTVPYSVDAQYTADMCIAVSAWMTWARSLLDSHAFDTPRQKRIWALYADGKPLTEIQHAEGGSRRSITKQLARVKDKAPTAPVQNPWRQDRIPLRPSKADTEKAQLLRLVPREDDEMPTKQVTYAKIKLRSGFGVFLPNRPNLEMDTLINIDGEPHVGGIDVLTGDEMKPKITVPWWKIQQADQAAPGV